MHLAINAYFWNRANTGSGQYTRQLVYHFNRLVSDLDITLIFPQAPGEPGPEAVPPSVKVELVPVRAGHLGKVRFEQLLFPRACRQIGADIAHVPYWGSPLQSPIPLVVTVHDLTTLLVRDYHRGLRARLYNALISASARASSHVITDSLASKRDIVKHLGLPEDRVTPIYLAVEPVDMRKSFNGLWAVASEKLKEDPKRGAVFAFTNKKRNRLKLLYWDTTGVWVLAKRLEEGRFSWPIARTGAKLSITPESLTMIMSGIELQKGLRKAWYER